MSQPNETPSRGVVLIADDEEFVRVGLAEVLRREGFVCTPAANGAEALARLQEAEFEALISDIHMPGNAHLEMVAAARKIAPALPIVLLTGRPSVETASRSVRLPVTAYLTKPPNIDELVALLEAAVADYRGLRALQAGRARLRTWDQELDEIERTLRSAPAAVATGGALNSYLRLSLRQVILMLADLERATSALDRTGQMMAVEHEAALRRTVEVLERTKQNFKSRDLAELRRSLESLLAKPDDHP